MADYPIKTKLCSGIKCIHRYRCYRHSLYNDAKFKGMNFEEVDINECIDGDEEIGFKYMWLPKLTKEEII